MKDLLVQSRFRNLQLWDLLAGRSVAEVCQEINVDQCVFGGLLNLKLSPKAFPPRYKRSKNPARLVYRKAVTSIAAHFKMLPEDLFPDSLYALALPDRVERTYDSVELLPLLAAGGEKYALPPTQFESVQLSELKEVLNKKLATLPGRESRVLRLRSGLEDGEEHTLEEVGKIFGVTCNRIRQIEAKAIRRMRHPSRSGALAEFVGVGGQLTMSVT